MKSYSNDRPAGIPLKTMVFAGLYGGMAEILWVSLYACLTPVSGLEVARQVTASVFPAAAQAAYAPALGIGIHLVLSLALGLVFATSVWPLMKQHGTTAILPTALGVLIGVWLMNFLVILPLLNPAFVALMPYGATFASKLLFACAMAGTLLYAWNDDALGIQSS